MIKKSIYDIMMDRIAYLEDRLKLSQDLDFNNFEIQIRIDELCRLRQALER